VFAFRSVRREVHETTLHVAATDLHLARTAAPSASRRSKRAPRSTAAFAAEPAGRLVPAELSARAFYDSAGARMRTS
jgi:hypothetical protein